MKGQPEFAAFMQRYGANIKETFALEDRLKERMDRAQWHELLAVRAKRLRELIAVNDADLAQNLLGYVSGERALDDDTADEALRRLYFMALDGLRDPLCCVEFARKLAQYCETHGSAERFAESACTYSFHLNLFFYIQYEPGMESMAQTIREAKRWYRRVVERCPDIDSLSYERARAFAMTAYANLVISQNIADPDSTGDEGYEWLEKLRPLCERHPEMPDSPRMLAEAEQTLLTAILYYELPTSPAVRAWAMDRGEALYQSALEQTPDPMQAEPRLTLMHAYHMAPDAAFDLLAARLNALCESCRCSQDPQVMQQYAKLFDLTAYALTMLFRGTRTPAEQQALCTRTVQQMLAAARRMPQNVGMPMPENANWPCVSRLLSLPLPETLKRELLLSLNVFRQISTSIHVQMVALIVDQIIDAMLRLEPELLVGTPGVKTAADVHAKAQDIRRFVHESALFHDVGKIRFAETINMQYRKLTDEEFACIQTHTVLGAQLLKAAPSLACYRDIALGHHKTHDGQHGYPASFDHRRSPYRFFIELIAIADCLDAATDTIGRSYKRAKTFQEVYGELAEGSGTRYSPVIVDFLGRHAKLRETLAHLVEQDRLSVCYNVYQTFLN